MEPKHPVVDELVKLLKALRTNQKLTLDAVADAAGIHRTHLGLVERAERSPSVAASARIAEALGYSLSEILQEAELISSGKAAEDDVFASEKARQPKSLCLRNEEALLRFCGLSAATLLEAIHGCYKTLDTIDRQLMATNTPPIGRLVELANLSSMVGNLVGASLAEASQGLYKRNRPHHYPDLLPQSPTAVDLELKMALETNRPKGHLPKPGNFITFRYVLGSRLGVYSRGKETRGDTVWIWEVKIGKLRAVDYDISNTEGDSGKTANIKSKVFNEMALVYYDPLYLPYAARGHDYPGFN